MPEAPAEITPATPEAPAAQTEARAPATGTTEAPTAPPEPTKAATPWDDNPEAKAEIERLRRENASDRTAAKTKAAEDARNEFAQSIGKALGLVKDEPVDPAELTKQLSKAQSDARSSALQLAVFRSSPDAETANTLLNWLPFREKVADIDPTDGPAIAEAIQEAAATLPALGKRTPAPNPAQGTSASGAPDAAAQVAAARARGDWQTVVALENQKLTALQ